MILTDLLRRVKNWKESSGPSTVNNKLIVIRPHNALLINNQKERASDTRKIMDKYKKH